MIGECPARYGTVVDVRLLNVDVAREYTHAEEETAGLDRGAKERSTDAAVEPLEALLAE